MRAGDPEYTESTAGKYQRSYDTYNNVLVHQASGSIWTGAEPLGKTARDVGEYQMRQNNKPCSASWQNLYCDTKGMAADPTQNTAHPMYSNVDPVAQQHLGARLPGRGPQHPRHRPVRDLELNTPGRSAETRRAVRLSTKGLAGLRGCCG